MDQNNTENSFLKWCPTVSLSNKWITIPSILANHPIQHSLPYSTLPNVEWYSICEGQFLSVAQGQ